MASPRWDHQLFQRSVCLVVHHNAEGAVGIFLNRSMNFDASELWKQLGGKSLPGTNLPKTGVSGKLPEQASPEQTKFPHETKIQSLHFGGPKAGPVVAIHNRQELAEFASADGVYFAAQLAHLQELLASPVDGTELKIIVGQADWPAGVLDAQFAAGCWLPLPVLPKLVFEEGPAMWATAIREVGNRFVLGMIGDHSGPDDVLAN